MNRKELFTELADYDAANLESTEEEVDDSLVQKVDARFIGDIPSYVQKFAESTEEDTDWTFEVRDSHRIVFLRTVSE